MTQERRYWHPVVGYNYRMTNIQAAIGLAQVERFEEQLRRHREVASWYREELAGVSGSARGRASATGLDTPGGSSSAIVEETFAPDRDAVLKHLKQAGIDARRIYYPMHQLPIYRGVGARQSNVSRRRRLADRAVCLPTWAGLTGTTSGSCAIA